MKCAAARLCVITMSTFALAAGADEAPSLSPGSGIVWVPLRGAIGERRLTLIVQDHRCPGEIKHIMAKQEVALCGVA
jgi:hypothetical protein